MDDRSQEELKAADASELAFWLKKEGKEKAGSRMEGESILIPSGSSQVQQVRPAPCPVVPASFLLPIRQVSAWRMVGSFPSTTPFQAPGNCTTPSTMDASQGAAPQWRLDCPPPRKLRWINRPFSAPPWPSDAAAPRWPSLALAGLAERQMGRRRRISKNVSMRVRTRRK